MFEGLTFKLAEGGELARALDLQRAVYTADLGHVPRDGFDERAYHLIAYEASGRLVAVVRIVGPDQRPFDVERFVNLSDFIPAVRTPALIGRLCIRHDQRGVSKSSFIPLGMLKLACAFARKRGFTDFVMYTYPNLIAFYRGASFRRLGVTFEHPDWGTVHLMHLDLIDLEARCADSRASMARLLFATDLPNFLV